MTLSQQSSNLFVYTNIVQASRLQLQLDYVNIFAVFGINANKQYLQDSIVNITINFKIVHGALICIQCDLFTHESKLIFVASGQKLSGAVFKSSKEIYLVNSLVSFRFDTQYATGIVGEIIDDIILKIIDTNITGFVFENSQNHGYVSSNITVNTKFVVENSRVCVNIQSAVKNDTRDLQSLFIQQCQHICQTQIYVYGLCLSSLSLGQLQLSNSTLLCLDPFEYDGLVCVCKEGYLLNLTTCVDIVETLTILDVSLASNASLILQILDQNVSLLSAQIQQNFMLNQQNLIGNVTILTNLINKNNDTLTAQLAETIQNLSTVNNTLSQTTWQLIENLNKTNNTLQQQIIHYNNNVSRINNTLEIYQNMIDQINQSVIISSQKLYSDIFTLNDSFNSFKVTSNQINTQQSNDIMTQFNYIKQLNTTITAVVNNQNSMHQILNTKVNNQLQIIPQKVNVIDVYIKSTIDWYINDMLNKIHAINARPLPQIPYIDEFLGWQSCNYIDNHLCVNCTHSCAGCATMRQGSQKCWKSGCGYCS
ncbi:Growth_factor receptor cysteine-rich domain superfamily [Hexamita inflata]|uniref:Growth factor receptor cysteine-rich domain superfamily n=1 Tax=Hexamita inflata TaxID=28002 RepID=A0AA86R5E8_9EUKA|nr:Growth factor receptor cysteine-rich domain superfamily [Hexamita inflata]